MFKFTYDVEIDYAGDTLRLSVNVDEPNYKIAGEHLNGLVEAMVSSDYPHEFLNAHLISVDAEFPPAE